DRRAHAPAATKTGVYHRIRAPVRGAAAMFRPIDISPFHRPAANLLPCSATGRPSAKESEIMTATDTAHTIETPPELPRGVHGVFIGLSAAGFLVLIGSLVGYGVFGERITAG